jgi:hypothetical protein
VSGERNQLRIKNEELRMKGVYGGEYLSKRKELLPKIQSRLFENQGAISFFIFHSLSVRADTHQGIEIN